MLNSSFALLSAIRTLGSCIWSLKFNFFFSKLEGVPGLPWQRIFCSLAEKDAAAPN